ncbi:MAG: hypothetical protein ACTHM7_21580 [Ginsengibacter sp.]
MQLVWNIIVNELPSFEISYTTFMNPLLLKTDGNLISKKKIRIRHICSFTVAVVWPVTVV